MNLFRNLKRDWSLVSSPFYFKSLKVFDNPHLKYLILKITCMQFFLGLFTKIKKGSGASFWCIFSAWFFYNNVPYLILYQWTKFPCHTSFPCEDIKQNVFLVLIQTNDDVINFKIYIGSSSKAMADREKKRGRWKYKNLNISRRKKAF